MVVALLRRCSPLLERLPKPLVLTDDNRGMVSALLEDILLHEADFPTSERDFFTVVSPSYFKSKYGGGKVIKVTCSAINYGVPKRLATVLPLRIGTHGKEAEVIPVPAIVDTGAALPGHQAR